MNQFFQEGETVIVESKMFPECNGEYIICGRIYPPGKYPLPGTIDNFECDIYSYTIPDCVRYIALDSNILSSILEGGKTPIDIWPQHCLRKKYPPNKDSYEEIVGILNNIKETA